MKPSIVWSAVVPGRSEVGAAERLATIGRGSLFTIHYSLLPTRKIRPLAPKWPTLLCVALLLAPLSAVSQVVADGATNTLSNFTNTFTGDVTVGTNGSFTLLVLSDNTLLTNAATAESSG